MIQATVVKTAFGVGDDRLEANLSDFRSFAAGR